MSKYSIPYSTILIAFITLIYSSYVAVSISGSLFGELKIIQLENYGGVRLEHLYRLQLWRLFLAQIIHVKISHMFFNVLSLFFLGVFVERHVGFIKFLGVWFVGGALGTLFSTFFTKYPWNLGTGSSQAIMAIAGMAAVLLLKKVDTSRGLKFVFGFTVLPVLILDFTFAHYPKPGHTLSFILGIVITLVLIE